MTKLKIADPEIGYDMWGRPFYFTEAMAKKVKMPPKNRRVPMDDRPLPGHEDMFEARSKCKRFERFYQKARVFFCADRGLPHHFFEVEGKYVAIYGESQQVRFVDYAYLAAGLDYRWIGNVVVINMDF